MAQSRRDTTLTAGGRSEGSERTEGKFYICLYIVLLFFCFLDFGLRTSDFGQSSEFFNTPCSTGGVKIPEAI
jgi:hypothetical protein